MQNSNMFTRNNTPDPSVRGEGSLFPFSEIVSTLSNCTTMQNSKIHPGTKPRPTDFVLGEGKFFRSPKMY